MSFFAAIAFAARLLAPAGVCLPEGAYPDPAGQVAGWTVVNQCAIPATRGWL